MSTISDKRQSSSGNVAAKSSRVDHLLIADMVASGSRVLDVGCGEGGLLRLLTRRKNVDGRGVEISQEGVNRAVSRGLSVIQGDADRDLVDYPDGSFDYAILSQTLQATRRPRHVLNQLLRIGKHAIVSFPNFGHWSVRTRLMVRGRMPVSNYLPYSWYETPNIHLCTIKDFRDLCAVVDGRIERVEVLNGYGRRLPIAVPLFMQNLIGEQAVFQLTR